MISDKLTVTMKKRRRVKTKMPINSLIRKRKALSLPQPQHRKWPNRLKEK